MLKFGDVMVIILCGVVLFLIFYIMRLEAKIKKFQNSVLNMQNVMGNLCKDIHSYHDILNKTLNTTNDVNSRTMDLINMNTKLVDYNTKLCSGLRQLIEVTKTN